MKNNKLLYLLIAILVIWNIILTSNLYVDKSSETNTIVNNIEVDGFSTDFTNVISEIKSSNVLVESEDNLLSGFIYKQIDNKIYVLTAGHGVINQNNIKVILASGESLNATLLGNDLYSDLALLEVDSEYLVNPVKFANSSLLKDGEFVLGIGTPNISEFALSSSLLMVSSNNRLIENSFAYNEETYEYYLNTIQLSGIVSNGFSGSGVYNMSGDLVGMITMSLDGGQDILAITSNEIKLLAEKMLNQEDIVRMDLGVKGHSLKDLENYQKSNLGINLEITDGYYISEVKAFSIADKLGIKSKDVIVSINDKNISNYDSIREVMYSNQERYDIEVIRDSEHLNFELVLTFEASEIND